MDLELQGKTALISGSHRGTGAIIASRFAEEGCRVLVHAESEELALAGAGSIANSRPVWGDLTRDEGLKVLAGLVNDERIDILVNNFGAASSGSWDTSDTATWLEAYQANVLSAQRLIHLLLPTMRSRGWGRILNLGTTGSTRPAARMPHYYAAKGALATLTASLAQEAGDSGIRVNLVSPGLIRTPEVEAHFLRLGRRKGWGSTWPEIEPHIASEIPIGRIVTREEVASLVLFLASPLAEGIHGQNIRVDGGAVGIVI